MSTRIDSAGDGASDASQNVPIAPISVADLEETTMRTRHAALSFGFSLALPLLVAGSALAEGVNRTATIAPGKPARLAVITALKKDCSIGEVGSIRIVTPPKSGSLVIKTGKTKTPASFRCPNVETPVQALFYQPNGKFTGQDEVAYETKATDGATETFTVKINVTDKPAAPKKDLMDL